MIRLLEWMRKTCFKLSTGLLKTHPHTLIYIPSVFLHLKPVCQPLRSSFLPKKKKALLGFVRRGWGLCVCVCEVGGGGGECRPGQRLVGRDVTRHICHCP